MAEIKQKFTAAELTWVKRIQKGTFSMVGFKIYRHYSHSLYTSYAYMASSTFLNLLEKGVFVKNHGFIEMGKY